MGRRYKEPTIYRDKECPHCGLFFCARGLNGHILFRHGGYEKNQTKQLKRKLSGRIAGLDKAGVSLPNFNRGRLGSFSDATLDELNTIDSDIDRYLLDTITSLIKQIKNLPSITSNQNQQIAKVIEVLVKKQK